MTLDRFTVCSICYRSQTLDDAFAALAAAGFRRIDLFGVAPHFSADQAEVPVEAIEAACARHGVRIANLGTYVGRTFHLDDAASVREEIDRSLAIIALAKRLGARTVRTLPGEDADPAQIARMAPHFAELTPAAEEAGVHLVMENHHGRLAGVPDLAVRLCEAVGSAHFGIIYEPCNLLMGRRDYWADWRVMRDWVRHVHLKAGHWVDGKFERCHYGSGEVDIAGLITGVDADGYRGDYAVEYEMDHVEPPETGLVRWRQWLEAL
ncbi:MAG: sugar phosphate isomerase/epimerase [Armatimonadetes bacterium]|nr:sugar phosphate isomerase/epimerase [Armatimonadota bacterium]